MVLKPDFSRPVSHQFDVALSLAGEMAARLEAM